MGKKEESHCSEPNCDRPYHGRGYCKAHYKRAVRRGEFEVMRVRNEEDGATSGLYCRVIGCDRKRFSKGFCSAHYQRIWHSGDPQAHLPIAGRYGKAQT